jgi:hypothetical protein
MIPGQDALEEHAEHRPAEDAREDDACDLE